MGQIANEMAARGMDKIIQKIGRKRMTVYSVILVLAALIFALSWYGNKALVVTYYEYENGAKTQGMEGYRIVHLSDLHNALFGRENSRLLEMVRNQNPNVIMITGDLVDANRTNVKVAVQLADKLTQIAPVYYVTGNHESWLEESKPEKFKELMTGLEKAGVTILDNEIATVDTGKAVYNIIGLDDNDLMNGTLASLVENTSKEVLNVTLAHEPQYIRRYSEDGANLVLSGHAHGGQFRIPGVGGVYAPSEGFLPQYSEGKHEVNSATMVVSRGLGNSSFPIRIFNRPEIVCIDFK